MAKKSVLYKYLLGIFLIGSALFSSNAQAKLSSDNTINFGAHNESTMGRKSNGYGYIFESRNKTNVGNYILALDIEAFKKTLYVQNGQSTRVGKDDVDRTNLDFMVGYGNKGFSIMAGPYTTSTNANLSQDIVAISHKTNASGMKAKVSYKGFELYNSMANGDSTDNVEINLPAPLEKVVLNSGNGLKETRTGIEKNFVFGPLSIRPKIEQIVEQGSAEKTELKYSLGEKLDFGNLSLSFIQEIYKGQSEDNLYDAFFLGGGISLKW